MTQEEAAIIAEFIADWWAERLGKGDKETFRRFLIDNGTAELMKRPDAAHWRLECDYDPFGMLLEAVRAAGVECEGFMFSARGILPQKTTTSVYPAREAEPAFEQEAAPARIVIKAGYGNWLPDIPLNDVLERKVAS